MDKIDPIPLPSDRKIPLIDRTPPSTGQERRRKKEEKKEGTREKEPRSAVETDLDKTPDEKDDAEEPDQRGSHIDIQV